MKKLMLFLLVLCTGVYASAQTTVHGVVSSGADGLTMPGVSVTVKGTALGTATDLDGNFSLTIPSDKAVLVFTYIGYKAKEVAVTGSSRNLQVILNEDTQLLDELVVVGYGTMKRSDLTGAVASITAEQIKQGVNTSIEQAMQGRIAGVQVMQNSGAPGGGISVQIRGINSLNGNEPLYVIDGVAVSGQTSGNSSVLSSINPSDIVSLEVLKDASATAIYGSRASNGVVLITTKRGEAGKPKLNYEGYAGWQQLPGKIDVLNLYEYADYYNTRAEVQGWGIREDFRDPSLLTAGTDWQKELFRTAFMHNHQVGVSGGAGGTNYAVSGGFLNQDGIGLGSSFDRASFRVNLDSEITKWLKLGVNASYTHTKQVVTLDDNGLIRTALQQRPDIAPRNPDGTYGFPQVDQFNTYYSNPLFEAQMIENYNTGDQVNYNAYANITPVKGLDLRMEYGGNVNHGNNYFFKPEYRYGNKQEESESRRGSSKGDYSSFKTYATYNFDLAVDHHLSIMAGHEAQEGSWENLSGTRKGYISDAIHSLNVGDALTAQNENGGNSWAIESYYGRLNYNFADRYLLTATLRSDGSSNLGPNNRWGTFPSAALAWRVNNESFLKDIEAISNLKLRLGWGVVGNQNAGTYAYGTTMQSVTTAWGTGYFPGNFPNPDLKWEETKAYNIGLDIALFKNRVELVVDAYNKNTDNLLMYASLPQYIIYIDSNGGILGMTAPWVNAGAMNNKGIEFTLNTVNITNKDFTWRTGLTMSFNKNKLTKLYSDDSRLLGKLDGQAYTSSEIGQPVGKYFGYNVIGMFTQEADFYQQNAAGEFLLDENGTRIPVARPSGTDDELYPIAENSIWVGDYIFEDVDKDGKITEADRKYIGNPNPDFTFGFNNTFTYKNFELTAFFNGSVGNDVYNVLRQNYTDPLGYSNKLKEVADYARVVRIDPDGTNTIDNVYVSNADKAKVQRISAAGQSNNDNNRVSSRFVEDGSYIRLKSLSLAYNLPQNLLDKIGVSWVQVYANAQNLFTISSYSGYDPEVGAQGQDVLRMGLDNGRYPSQRIYNFGIKLNF
ncbi:MAG: TonB-dependent receptor [Candidatus Symbiothrix sp.]|jgi:TonB-linked SusC/RagA family outer membrane protein|nr:TonB-dependent receptor [Candidatus Symbiothrix sp.]